MSSEYPIILKGTYTEDDDYGGRRILPYKAYKIADDLFTIEFDDKSFSINRIYSGGNGSFITVNKTDFENLKNKVVNKPISWTLTNRTVDIPGTWTTETSGGKKRKSQKKRKSHKRSGKKRGHKKSRRH